MSDQRTRPTSLLPKVSSLTAEERKQLFFTSSTSQATGWHDSVKRDMNFGQVHYAGQRDTPVMRFKVNSAPFFQRSTSCSYAADFGELPLDGYMVNKELKMHNMNAGRGNTTKVPSKFEARSGYADEFNVPFTRGPPASAVGSSQEITNTIPRGSDYLMETHSRLQTDHPGHRGKVPGRVLPRNQMGSVSDFPDRELDACSSYFSTFDEPAHSSEVMAHRPLTMMLPEDDSSRCIGTGVPARVSGHMQRNKMRVRDLPPMKDLMRNRGGAKQSQSTPQLLSGAITPLESLRLANGGPG